jgi:hypothetical protein
VEKVRNEKTFLTNSSAAKSWLQKQLPIPDTVKNSTTPVMPDFPKNRKSFQTLSERGKRRRLDSLFTRKPDEEELNWIARHAKRRRLDFPTSDQRKKDNQTCMTYFDLDIGKARYIDVSRGNAEWPTYCQVFFSQIKQ